MTRVLVVDDDPVVLRMLAYVVEAQGYEAVRAANGVEALQQIDEQQIDVIISDIKMPEMDGLSLLHHVRNSPETEAIPVLLLTARLDAAEEISSNVEHEATFLTKPLSSAQLTIALSELLQSAP